MAQNIQDFFRVAQERGFARDFMLRVRSIGDYSFDEDDFVYITTKSLPDRTIINQATPFMGLAFNVPGTVTYPGSDSWTVQFRNDINGIVRNKLEAWQRGIFDDQTSVGDISVPGTDRVIQLDLIGDQGDDDVRNSYFLVGVYVKGLGTIAYDLTGDGKLTTFDALLSYHYWQSSGVPTG